jgi:effector-binding domain-containing protein
MDGIKAKGYSTEPLHIMLDEETGTFSANMLIAIKEIPQNDPNVVIWNNATLYSSYYHGSFRDMKRQVDDLIHFVEDREDHKPARIYTWVTNCPRCWKQQGGPTTVLFAAVGRAQ